MFSRVSILARTLVVAIAALALLLVGLDQVQAQRRRVAVGNQMAQADPGEGEPGVRATELISIPFGFSGNLLLGFNNATVVASGEGACSDGQTITIAYTVTQAANSTTATGVWNGDCTGALQTWTSIANAMPGSSFSAGPAEACAFAETSDSQDEVTDSQEWCDPVTLTTTQSVFLPHVIRH